MATFALDEEVGGANVPLATPTEEKALLLSPTLHSEEKRVQGEQRSWDEIIPAAMLEQVEEDERQKEELQLYLPPRQRTVQVGRSTVAMTSPSHPFLPTSRTTVRTSSLRQWQLMGGVMGGGPEEEGPGGGERGSGGRRHVLQLTPVTALRQSTRLSEASLTLRLEGGLQWASGIWDINEVLFLISSLGSFGAISGLLHPLLVWKKWQQMLVYKRRVCLIFSCLQTLCKME